MTTLACIVGLLIGFRFGPARGLLAAGSVLLPWAGAAIAVTILLRRRYRRPPQVDVVAVARLAGIALRAGLSLPQALAHAEERVSEPTRGSVGDLRRRAQHDGLGPALAATQGPLGPFARRLAGIHRAGASLTQAIDGFERELVEAGHAERVARVRRLPVQLTLPLVLLVLPGCVLLLVGPTVIDELNRMIQPFGVLP